MPVIRISDATWERLKRWAIPLEDSPEDAVRKVLDVADEQLRDPTSKSVVVGPVVQTSQPNKRLSRGERIPENAYYHPILETLVELGGSGRAGDVLGIVGAKMKPFLADVDYQMYPSGAVVWQKTANFARNTLRERGLLTAGSPHGIWEISQRGRETLQSSS